MGRYGVDRPRVLELLRQGATTSAIAEDQNCKASTISNIKREFRKLGTRWDGDDVEGEPAIIIDDHDADDSEEAIGWPGPRPPRQVELDPEVLEARKQTALMQQELSRLKVQRELKRLEAEIEGKPLPVDPGLNFQREMFSALLAQANRPAPASMWNPQTIAAVAQVAVGMVQAFRTPPTDPVKMFSEFQKIISSVGGGGGVEDVDGDSMLGVLVRALAKTPAPVQPAAAMNGQQQQHHQAGPPPQIDERKRRAMNFLGYLANECRMGSDPATIAAQLHDALGVLPDDFRRMLLQDSLQSVLSALPAIVPVPVAQDFQSLAGDSKHRAWLEALLANLRSTNRVGGLVDEVEEPVEPPEGFDLFPEPDPSSSVRLPPNGPQVPATE